MALATPRTWVVGEVVAAATLNAELRDQFNELIRTQPLFVRKTADTSVSSDDTPNNDPHLVLPVAANAVYTMSGYLIYSTPILGDFNIDWTAPTGAVGSWSAAGPPTDAVTPSGDNTDRVRFSETSLTAARSFGGLVSSSTKIVLHLRGLLITSSTAGDYQLQWSQNTSDGASATVYTHSWLKLQRED